MLCVILNPTLKPVAGPLLPLNPEPTPAVHADIYPGLSGRLLVSGSTWNSYALSPPDEVTLRYIYDVGRRDAGLWVVEEGLVSAARVVQALSDTELPEVAPAVK